MAVDEVGLEMSGDSELRARRLEQLRAMSSEELDECIRRMRLEQDLPELLYHFRTHRAEFDADTPEAYHALFKEHIRRDGLIFLTYIRPRGSATMWHLVDLDLGNVAQYNETRREYWSFFRPRNLDSFVEASLRRSVEVRRATSGWETLA